LTTAAFTALILAGFPDRFHIFALVPPFFCPAVRRMLHHHIFRGSGEVVMAKPAVVLIGADKGGVGKTTVARTLLDYFTANQVRVRAFDTEVPRGTLKRFHPEMTEIVDINLVPDQMKIFDTLQEGDASVTLIDVRAGLMSPTLKALRDIGFIDAAKKGQLTFAVFHILGPSIASLDEIAETAAQLGDAKYFMVKNFINNTHFFEWDEATHSTYFKRIKDAVEITIPKLSEMATEQVELASVPFVTFIANKKRSGEPAANSFVLRGYVRHWLGNVWAEYDRIGVTEIVRPKESAGEPAGRPRPVMRIAEAAS
jgi:hypothetical protein